MPKFKAVPIPRTEFAKTCEYLHEFKFSTLEEFNERHRNSNNEAYQDFGGYEIQISDPRLIKDQRQIRYVANRVFDYTDPEDWFFGFNASTKRCD